MLIVIWVHVQSAPVSATGTWADFFANLASLKALQTLSISGSNSFNGTLLPQQLVPGQATICDLARARLGYLKIGDPLAGSQTLLNGTLPACLIDSQSQLRTLSIGTALKLSSPHNLPCARQNLG